MHTQVRRETIESAGMDNFRAACLRRRVVRLDHIAHPLHFTREVAVVHAQLRTNFDKQLAV